jgi:hypothetical protein
MPDLAELLDAGRSEATLLVLFIPSADREGDRLGKKEQKRWVRKALKLLGETLRGATAFPRGWGVWRDDARGGRPVWDRPVLIQCFTNEEALRAQSAAIRDFLNDRAGMCSTDLGFLRLRFRLVGPPEAPQA